MSMVENLVKALGIDPDQLRSWIASIVADAKHVRDQVDAAKQGFVGAVGHFNNRLDTIEKQNALMLQQQALIFQHLYNKETRPGAGDILLSPENILYYAPVAPGQYLEDPDEKLYQAPTAARQYLEDPGEGAS